MLGRKLPTVTAAAAMSDFEQQYYSALYSARAEAEATIPRGRGEKRKDYWSWEQFYMSMAFLSALRSRDPNTQVILYAFSKFASYASKPLGSLEYITESKLGCGCT